MSTTNATTLKLYKDYWPEPGHGPGDGFKEGYLSDLEISLGDWIALPIDISQSDADWSLLSVVNHDFIRKELLRRDPTMTQHRDVEVSVKTEKSWDDRNLFLFHPEAAELIAWAEGIWPQVRDGIILNAEHYQREYNRVVSDCWVNGNDGAWDLTESIQTWLTEELKRRPQDVSILMEILRACEEGGDDEQLTHFFALGGTFELTAQDDGTFTFPATFTLDALRRAYTSFDNSDVEQFALEVA